MTDKTQALLPVTPVAYLHKLHMEGGQTYERLTLFNGIDPDDARVTAFGLPGRDYSEEYSVSTVPLYARISHSLPGDVGMRDALEKAIGWFEGYADNHTAKGTEDGRKKAVTNQLRAAELRAALTPSPCPGDGMREALEGLSLAADEINGDIDLQVNGDHSEEVDVNGEYYVTLSVAKVVALNKAICVAQRLLKKAPAPPTNSTIEKILTLAKRKYDFQPTIGAVLRSRMPTGTTGHDWDDKEAFSQAIAILDLIPDLAALTPSALSGDAGEGELQAALARRTSMSTIAGGGKRPHVEIRFANLADAHALTDAVLGRTPAGNGKIETSMTVQEAWAANKELVNSPTAVEDGDGLLYEPESSDTEKEREAYRLGYDHAMSGFPALVGPRIAAALTPSPCPGDVDDAARAAYAAHCAADPCNDFSEPDWSDGGYSAESFVWQAVAKSVLRHAPTDAGIQPYIAEAAEIAGRQRPWRFSDVSDAQKLLSKIAALTPSALSGDAGEGELQAALARRTSMSTIAGGGKRPHVEIRFANVADAHALTDAILNRSNKEDDHGPRP